MIDSNMKVKAVKAVSMLASVAIGVVLGLQGQIEAGVGVITAALSSAGLNSVQGE